MKNSVLREAAKQLIAQALENENTEVIIGENGDFGERMVVVTLTFSVEDGEAPKPNIQPVDLEKLLGD